ncbi:hypothetical protein KZZ52_30675 [Dactylosporangium sp. AC04546]|uniref:hypothetical protein n=1 Tax=Dactylosporangium sp. AC04546 TaxID=2862460 RepID=UPI001EDCA491|nr:hypothetical protein [Dactylosporangium sp. AC04546]WVK78359.1 hypothetical protein KZZ52_30675 [Dactylosporangium sp. AC04546]
MISVGAAVDVLVVASVAVGVPLAVRGRAAARGAVAAEWWLAGVVAAIYLNQVLFTVYVVRVHGGDPAFVARYLPAGWFALADGSLMRSVAGAFPAPELLSWSVLRVQAVLELPFVILAYLCAARRLSPGLARRLASPAVLWAGCVAWTVVFSLVEWGLFNPWTYDDLVLRAVSGVLTPLVVGRWVRVAPDDARSPGTAGQVLLAVLGVAAIGVLVLVVYDTALLYNLGHLPGLLPVALVAGAVLAGADRWARRLPAATCGPAAGTVAAGLGWFVAVFFVPALPIRYALDLGNPWLTAGAAAGVAVTALALALREVAGGLGAAGAARRDWLVSLGVAGAAGTAATVLAWLPPPTYPEVRLLLAAALFLVTTTVVAQVADRLVTSRIQKRSVTE